jgi:hypothetical protein
MNSALIIQCFVKPKETLDTLYSFEKCKEIKDYDLIIYVDRAKKNSLFVKENDKLIETVNKYAELNKNKYKDIIVIVSNENLGPYICCGDAINYAFENHEFVVFTEDDSIFTADTLNYFNFYRDGKIPNDEKCLGITSQTQLFSINNKEDIFNINDAKYKNLINNTLEDDLLNKIVKISNFSNKQFGIFKNKWNIIKHFRTHEYLLEHNIVSDYATTLFVAKNKYYSYYSVIPRTNDIGLFHNLGCTTLYWKQEVPLNTIKLLTFDNYKIDNMSEYKILNDQEYYNIKNKYINNN